MGNIICRHSNLSRASSVGPGLRGAKAAYEHVPDADRKIGQSNRRAKAEKRLPNTAGAGRSLPRRFLN